MKKYKLGDIAPIKQGVCDLTDKVWLLNLDAVESETGRVTEYVYTSPEEVGNSTITFDTTNVLYCKLRPYLNKVVLPEKDGLATSEMLPLKPDTSVVLREYLTYFLRSKSFVAHINSKTAGAKMPRANTKDLKNTEVPCPDIDTQTEIVKQIDACVSVIDKRNKQIQCLDDLIKARFVEIMDMSELSDETTVAAITERVKVGFVGTCEKYYTNDLGIPMVRTGNITDKGIDLHELKFVTEEFHKKNIKSQVHSGDLLIARHGSNGQANVYEGPEAQCLNVVIIVPDRNKVTPVFLAGLLNSPEVKMQIERTLVGSTQHVVNTKSIASLKVRVPDPSVQAEYEKFVRQVDKSKVAIQNSLDKTQLLFDSLMQEYFG